jgi:multiple sugar transport system permease protein
MSRQATTKPAVERAGTAARRPDRRRQLKTAQTRATWFAPLLAIATVFYLYPMFEVIRFSFTDATLVEPDYEYTLNTYKDALGNPVLPEILGITGVFLVFSVIGQLVLGLLVALAVQRGTARRLPGTVFVRSVVLCSWVMPGVVIGILWQIVLNDGAYGLVNAVLLAFGLPSVSFLATPTLALVSVTVANIWRGTAFSMLLQYAGLQGINPDVYEAARMDGAGRWKSFWYITLPLLRPIIALNVILITISTLNTFDMVLALTGGGPGQSTEVLSLFIYNTIFRNQDLASGSVLAVFLLLISLLLTMAYRRLLSPQELR